MSNSTRIKLIGFVLLLFSQSLFGQTLYWVGGSGDWNDNTHWSLNSDGSYSNPSFLIPDATRSVVFNDNSFPSNADKTVTLNVAGACLDMTWTDDADDPIFAISSGLDLSIHGSLAILDGVTVSPTPADAAVEFVFSATSGTPTISTEGTYVHNIRIGDESFASTAVFTLSDQLNCRWINVLSGTFDTNDQSVTAFKLNADEDNTQTRAMSLGSSEIILTGSGAGTDLDLSGSNFTLNAETSTIDLSNTGNVVVELGPVSRALNNITFSGAGAAVTINNFNSGAHTFNQLSAADNSGFDFSGTSTSTFSGIVNIGVSGGITNTFPGPVNFNDDVNLNTNENSGTFDFDDQVAFGAGADLIAGANSNFSFGGAASHTFQNITINHSSSLSFDNATTNSISNLIVNSVSGTGSSFSFPDGVGNATTISGSFSISSTCSTPVTVNSVSGGSQAYLTIAGSPTWDGVVVQDINENGAGTITIDRGNISNVTNITASSSCAGNILYWVGTDGGCDGTWNDGDCWSSISGGAGGDGQPTATQDVVFDVNSFDGSNNTVSIDANNPVCKSMNWTGVTNSPTFQRTGGNYLSIYGSLTLEAGMTWSYNDQVFFLGSGDFTITSAGQSFTQYLRFYNTTGSWKLLDEFSSSSHVYLQGGTLNTNDQNFTALELDANYSTDETRTLTLGSSYITLTNSGGEVLDIRSTGDLLTFNAGTSTFEFTNTGTTYVELGTNDRTFYNIIGNAGTLGGNRLDFRNGDNAANYNYNDITLIDGKSLRFVQNVVVNGEVNTGTDSEIFFNGANNVFHSSVNLGSITSSSVNAHFYNSNTFNGNVTVTGPTQDTDRNRFYNSVFNGTVTFVGSDTRGRFYNDCTFNGLVDLSSDASTRFYGNDVFNAGANFGDFVTFGQTNTAGLVTTFNGASPITFADNTNTVAYREIVFGGPVSFGDNAYFRTNEGDGNTTFEDDFTTGTGANVIINNNGSGSALFQGLVNIGENATQFDFDRDATFEQLVTIGDGGTAIDFDDDTDFQSGLLIQGTANNYGAIQFYGTNTFSGGTIDFTTGTTDFGVVFENSSSNTFDATSPVVLRSGARVSFRETDVFNGTFTAEDNARVRFTERNNGGSSTIFNDNVICGNDVHFESNRDITFNGDLTFGTGADFMVNDAAGAVVVEGNVVFGENAIDIDFQGTTSVFKGSFTIGDGGNEIDFRNTTDFQSGLLISGTANNDNAIQFYGTNTFSGGTVDFTTGTANYGITFEDGCNDTFDATSPVIVRANSRVSFRETDVFNGLFTGEDNTRIRFTDRNNGGTSTTFNDNVICGDDVHFESNRDITFNANLTFGTGADFMVNENAGSVTVEGDIVFGDNAIDIDFRGTTSTFKGSFLIGDNGNEIDFRNTTDFQGGLIISGTANNNDAVQFYGTNTFSGGLVDLTSGTTSYGITFEDGCNDTFDATSPVIIRASSRVSFRETDVFNGTFTAEDDVIVRFTERNNGGSSTTFNDNVVCGDNINFESNRDISFTADLTFGDNVDFMVNENAGVASVGGNLVFGENATDIDFRGTTTTFNGSVSIGINANEVDFRNITNFLGGLTILGTTANDNAIQFYGTNTFSGGAVTLTSGSIDWSIDFEGSNNNFASDAPVLVKANSHVRFIYSSDFDGTLVTEDGVRMKFAESSGGTTTFDDDVTFGADNDIEFEQQITFNLPDPGNPPLLTIGSNTNLVFDNNAGTNTIRDFTLTGANFVRFRNNATSNITGTVTMNAGDCSDYFYIENLSYWSNNATVNFTDAQVWSGVILRGMNFTGNTVTINDGADMGNNSGTTFNNTGAVATLYWIGGTTGNSKPSYLNNGGITDNWNNPANWSTSSGGSFGSCVPGPEDNVIFDNNSFSDGTNLTVHVNYNEASCHDMTWTSGVGTGVTNNPTLNVDYDFSISGSVLLSDQSMTISGDDDIFFIATTTGETITSNGVSFGNDDIEFNGLGGEWILQDEFTVSDNIDLFQGVLNTNDQDVNCSELDAYNGGLTDLVRSLVVGNSEITMTGSSTVVDIRSAGNNFSMTSDANSQFTFSRSSSDYILELDTFDITLPNLLFESPTSTYASTIRVRSGENPDVANSGTLTFRNITKTATGGRLNIDETGTSYRRATKIVDNISIADNTNFYFESSRSGNSINGTVLFGDDCNFNFRSSTLEFGDSFTAGTGSTGDFHTEMTFKGPVIINGTSSTTDAVEFHYQYIFEDDVTLGDGSVVSFRDNDDSETAIFNGDSTLFMGTFTGGNDVSVEFSNAGRNSSSTYFTGDVLFGDNLDLNIRESVTFEGNFTTGTAPVGEVAGDGSSDLSWFKGNVTIGGNANQFIFYRRAIFESLVDIGSNATVQFNDYSDSTFFKNAVTTGAGSTVSFDRYAEFHNTLVTGNASTANFNLDNAGSVLFHDDVTFGTDSDNSFYRDVNFEDVSPNLLLTMGQRSSTSFYNGASGRDGIFEDILLETGGFVTFDNDDNQIENFTSTSFNTIELSTDGNTVINESFIASVNCDEWQIVRSSLPGTTAIIQFIDNGGNVAPDWSGIVAQDLTVLGPTNTGNFPLTIREGVNLDNLNGDVAALITTDPNVIDSGHGSYDENVTIYLDAERTPMTFYWIGNGGTVPPGGGASNSNWSNANNWSNTSGGAAAGCIPNPIDAVVFDNNSFDGGGQSVVIDAANAACGDFTFSHTTNTGANSPSFEGDALNKLQVFEDFTINNNMDNNFLGNFEFITVESSKYDLINTDNDSIHFNGNVYFVTSYPSSSSPYNWLINDPINMNDGDTSDVYDADFNLERGYLDANGQTITIEGSWVVEDDGNYVHNNNTVIFDGWISDKDIISNDENFYNLYVQKGDSLDDLRSVNYPIVVENDLIISTGRLWDSDESTNGPWQIDGDGAGSLTIGDKGTLVIGDNTTGDVATEFPSSFATYSISDISVVNFKDAGEQNVYGPFSYGNVVMSNGSDNDSRAKLLEDVITINGTLTIEDDTRFFDQGFQVTGNANSGTQFIIEGDGRFQIGVEATGTVMPEFPGYDFNINSRVIYNAGVDQTIKGIDDGGAGNGSYGNIQIVNPSGTPSIVLKTFDASSYIRRDLDIDAYNNVWDNGNQITAEGSNNGSHQLEMEANTILTIGSAGTSTTFPTFHRNRVFVNEASTVIYASGAASQDIRRLDNGDASNESYGNLMILNFDSVANTNGIVSKTLVASPLPRNGGDNLKVRGTLFVGEYNNLIDDGYQINGNAAGGLIKLADNSILTLGNGTTATVFPANFDDFDLDVNNEVIYNAGVVQTIKGLHDAGGSNPELEYGHLTLTNSAGAPTLIDKTLDGLTSVRGNLTINVNNNLVDDGYQIEGGDILTVAGDARLTLGGTSTSSGNTTFPTSFATVDLNALASPTSTVVYTSNRTDADQEVAALGYGHLIIDSWSTSVSTNKVMQGSITVNGNLDIEEVDSDQDLTLKDNGFQIIGNATGILTMNPYSNLEIGNGTTSTLFPTVFTKNNTNVQLDDESEVIYNAGDGAAGTLPQVISGGFDYGHLTLTNPNAGGLVEKILDSPITVDGDLIVNIQNHLNDDGNQITGNATGLFSMAVDTRLTLGKDGVLDATAFPLTFTRTNSFIQLDDASEVIYNAGDDNTSLPQIVAGGFSYGDLTFTNPTAGGMVNKELEAVVSIDGDLNINTLNNVFDKGFQVSGNATGIMAIVSGGQLNIGDGASATQFPSNYISANIALNENSTVNYSADADQLISITPGDGTGGAPYGQGYGNLEISNSTTTVVYKDLNASNTDEVKIQGNLEVYNWTTFRDLGTQINGPSSAGKYIEMGQQGGAYATGGEARIILGTGAFGGDADDATEMPRGWTVLNSGTSAQEINPTQSSIWYGAGTSQIVNADFPYGNLVLAIDEEDLNETGSTIRKYLQSYSGGTNVNVYGNIQIGGRNEFDDNGIQMVGNAARTFTMEEDAELRLGTNTVATVFPTNFISGNISIDVNSIVYYSSGIDQDVSGTPSAYGDVIITSAVGTPTKTLTGNVDIDGNLTIENNNILDAGSGSNFNINLAGNWTNNSGFTPRSGKVEFDGNANQDVTSGTSKFHDVELNNSAGITLQDDLTIEGSSSGQFTFTDGFVNMVTAAADTVLEEELIFEDGADYTGAGIASHSVAPVRKIGTSDFTMPVGDGSGAYYNPVGVSDITGGDATTAFVGQYFPFSPEGSYTWLNKDTTIHHVSRKEYWMLDREVTTASAKVSLYYQNPRSEVTDSASLLIARWDSNDTIWQDKGASAFFDNAVTSNLITEFSPFTFADYHPINPLPVTLVAFNAKYIKGEGVDLTWKTANETGNAGFILKRSIGNSSNFEIIAHYDDDSELVGKGNTGRLNNYYYLDDIGISPGEVHYYQLVQVDKDGNTTSSEIKAVNVGSEVVLYQNHPNPARNKTTLSFSIDTEQKTVLEVFDMNGRKVATVVDEILEGGTYQYPLNISNLQTGIYTARLIHGKKVLSIKMSIIN